jgi:hypothetical protein
MVQQADSYILALVCEFWNKNASRISHGFVVIIILCKNLHKCNLYYAIPSIPTLKQHRPVMNVRAIGENPSGAKCALVVFQLEHNVHRRADRKNPRYSQRPVSAALNPCRWTLV